jgi:hypothetical protein
MVHCVSDTCRQEIEEAYSFCPFCGTDNRPPEMRPPVKGCYHRFLNASGYCILCGAKYGSESPWSGRPLQIRLGLLGVGFGCLLFLSAFLIWEIHSKGSGPGYDWIHSWYDVAVQRRGKYGNTYTELRGSETIGWMVVVGMVSTMFGLGGLFPGMGRRGWNTYNDWSS